MKHSILAFLIAFSMGLLSACSHLSENQTSLTEDDSKTFRLAERLKENGEYHTAIKLYHEILTKEVNFKPALLGLSESLTAIKDFDQAKEVANTGLAYFPNDIDLLKSLGKIHMAMHASKECIAVYEKIYAKTPQDPMVLNGLGVCSDIAHDHKKAQTFYEKALIVQPKLKGVRSNLGLSYALGGDYKKSIKILEAISKSSKATSRDRQNLALAYGLSGQFDKAAQIYRIDLNEEATSSNISYLKQLCKNNKDILAQITSPVTVEEATIIKEELREEQEQQKNKTKKKSSSKKPTPLKTPISLHKKKASQHNVNAHPQEQERESAPQPVFDFKEKQATEPDLLSFDKNNEELETELLLF
jgi:Flp pilus assembly protein TadD